DLALWNGYIIYTKTGGNMSPLKFRLSLIQEMIQKYWDENVSLPMGRPRTSFPMHRLSGKHFPEAIPASEKKRCHMKRCVVCAKLEDPATGKKIRRETRYQCDSCNVALCVLGCFRLYHPEAHI
ncbi:unnamed protein product, partial [Rotaria magnacalcarata]